MTVHRYSRAVNPPQVTPRRDAAPAVTLSAQTYRRLSSRSDSQPRVWLWGQETDLLVFGGSAVVALLAVLWARYSGVAQSGVFPEWAFIVFILMIDVAHVYATLFRTYLDGSELRRHPARYYGVPIVLFAVLGSTHWLSSAWFWTGLAYAAVFHFVRQQAGWVSLYRKLACQGLLDKCIDNFAIYLATLYPLIHWHANLDDRRFSWLVAGDFIAFTWSPRVVDAVSTMWALSLAVFTFRQLYLGVVGAGWLWGKSLLVATTAVCWFVGIVATNSDFEFTVTNVIIHGIPYFVLLWRYRIMRRTMVSAGDDNTRPPRDRRQGGLVIFLVTLVTLALLEETLWDRFVYHERSWLLGWVFDVELSSALLHVGVALLALPQATHYVLDGIVWRRQDTTRLAAQRWALGLQALEAPADMKQKAGNND